MADVGDPSIYDPANSMPTPTNYATPTQLAQLRALAGQTLQLDPSATKGGWASMLAGLLSGVNAGRMQNQAQNLQNENMRWTQANTQQGFEGLNNAYGGGGGASAAGYGPPGSGAREDAAYYTKAGLSPVAAAGLAGGFQAESGNNPNVSKVGDGRDGSPSFGKGQWNADRARNLLAYAAAHGASPNDPNIQRQFPLVEMALAGSPSDPGYGHERQAGAMLMAAKTPQDATAAALQYERPGGWKPGNPMAAYSAQKRLAYTTALLGSGAQGAQGQAGALGPVGASGAPQGMSPANAAAIATSPWANPATQAAVAGMYTPQQVGIPGGGTAYALPARGAGAQQSVGGVIPQSVSASPNGVTVPNNAIIGVNGPNGQTGLGGNSVQDTVKKAATMGAGVSDITTAQGIRNKDVESYRTAQDMAGRVESIRTLGDHIEDGALPIWGALALKYGINTSENAGRYAVYKAEIEDLLGNLGDKGAGLADKIPALGAPKDARDAFMDYVKRPIAYQQARSQRAMQGVMTNEDPLITSKALSDIPSPESTYPETKKQTQTAGGKGEGTSNANAAPPPSPLDRARDAIAKGAPREKVIERLKAKGIDPTGL